VRIDLVEKLVLGLVPIALLGEGALVGLGSIAPLGPAGIPDVAVDAALDTQDWLRTLRARSAQGPHARAGEIALPATPADPRSTSPTTPTTTEEPHATSTSYFVASSGAQDEDGERAFRDFPWLRRLPGVAYAQPQPVPEVLYRRYQSFEATWDLVQEGQGHFVSTSAGATAYQVDGLDSSSILATRIGLVAGDRIISVNGVPVGASLSAGQAMFEQLRGERRFAVLVEREGRPLVLSFFVN
jgi:hypothetical protein